MEDRSNGKLSTPNGLAPQQVLCGLTELFGAASEGHPSKRATAGPCLGQILAARVSHEPVAKSHRDFAPNSPVFSWYVDQGIDDPV
jgi:hypothetical protein